MVQFFLCSSPPQFVRALQPPGRRIFLLKRVCYTVRMAAEQMTLLIWESDVTRDGENRAVVTARQPVFAMSTKQAGKVLRCSERVVCKLYRNGILSGYKPGAIAKRSDGRKSNAAIKLDSESVIKYKAAIRSAGVF